MTAPVMRRPPRSHGAPARPRPRPATCLRALLCVLCAAATLPSAALVSMTYRVGFGDYARPGVWTPVFVTLANEPDPRTGEVADFLGRIEVRLPETIGDRGVTFMVPVELPANARKRFTVLVRFSDAPQEPRLHVVRPNGQDILSPESLTGGPNGAKLLRNPGHSLVACLQSPFESPAPLPASTVLRRTIRTAYITPDELPDRWFGLESLDVLVIPRLTDGLVSPEQAEAVVAWVRSGGRLLLLGGADATLPDAHPLGALLPVEPLGASEVELLGAMQRPDRVVLSDVAPRGGHRVLHEGTTARGRSIPLGYWRREGLGEVHYWPFSTRQRINALDLAQQVLWEALFRQDPHAFLRAMWTERYRPALSSVRVLENATEPPNVFFITIVIAVYFVVVGPLNFYVLQRRRRVELAWLTIPAIVLVFSIGMYAVGVLTMGRENLERSFSLVQAEAGQRTGRIVTMTGFFAARSATATIDVAEPGTSLTFGNLSELPSPFHELPRHQGLLAARSRRIAPAGVVTTAPALVPQRGELRLERFDLPQWGWSLLQADRTFDLGGGILADLRHEGARLAGTITNATPFAIDDAFVLASLAGEGNVATLVAVPVGRIEAGGAATVERDFRAGDVVASSEAEIDLSGFTSLERRFNESIHSVFLRQLAGAWLMPRGRAFLFGRVDRADDVPLRLTIGAAQRSHLALLAVHLPLEPVEGVVYPFGHMTPVPVAANDAQMPEWSTARDHTDPVILVGDSELVFAVESPFEPGSAVLASLVLRSSWAAGATFTLEWSGNLFGTGGRPSLGIPESPAAPRRHERAVVAPLAADVAAWMPRGLQAFYLRAGGVKKPGAAPIRGMTSPNATIEQLQFAAAYE